MSPAKLPPTKKVAARLKIAEAAIQFQTTKAHAIRTAQNGQRELARWWGTCARMDWRALHELLSA